MKRRLCSYWNDDGTEIPHITDHGTMKHTEPPTDDGRRKRRLRALGAKRLDELMTMCEMSAADVAAATGLNRKTVQRWRRGERAVPREPELVAKILRAFDCLPARAMLEQVQAARRSDAKRERKSTRFQIYEAQKPAARLPYGDSK